MPKAFEFQALNPELANAAVKHRNCARTAVTQVRMNVWKALQSGTARERAVWARIDRLGIPKLTCIEVCCGSNSWLASHINRSGGHSMRILWPPPCNKGRHGDPRRMSAEQKARTEARRRAKPRKPPPLHSKGRRPRNWYLNMQWETHQKAFLHYCRKLKPVKGTAGLLFHTSPMCRMFAAPQRLAHSKGNFNNEEHEIALQTLGAIRKAHRAVRNASKRFRYVLVPTHEQPPAATVDVTKPYDRQADWPWAIAPGTQRTTVNGCMVGVRSGGLPVFKGWVFECPHTIFASALGTFMCDRTHEHAQSKLNTKRKHTPAAHGHARAAAEPGFSVKDFEQYPGLLAMLLEQAAGYTVALKRLKLRPS